MTRATLLALWLLAVGFLLGVADAARRENARDRQQIEALQTQPFPPVHPGILWPPSEPRPAPHVCPPGSKPQAPIVTVPFHADEMP